MASRRELKKNVNYIAGEIIHRMFDQQHVYPWY